MIGTLGESPEVLIWKGIVSEVSSASGSFFEVVVSLSNQIADNIPFRVQVPLDIEDHKEFIEAQTRAFVNSAPRAVQAKINIVPGLELNLRPPIVIDPPPIDPPKPPTADDILVKDFEGKLDEYRRFKRKLEVGISGVTQDVVDLAADEVANQYDKGTIEAKKRMDNYFNSFGSKGFQMPFLYYKTASLTRSQAGSGNSSNWPLLIGRGYCQTADTDLKDTSNGGPCRPDGFDIRPYDGLGGTLLPYQLVSYDGTTGTIEMWVKITTLNGSGAGSDTVIYLYYGDATLTTDGSSNTTWNSNFRTVLHFNGSLNDSTSNAWNGVDHGGVSTASAGQVGKGLTLSGTSQWVELPAKVSTIAHSYTFWMKINTFTNVNSGLMTHFYGGASYQNTQTKNTQRLTHYYYGNADIHIDPGTATLSTGVWYHVAVTYDSSSGLKSYLNGTSDGTAAANGNLNLDYGGPPSIEYNIGTFGATNENTWEFDGIIDEARIASVAHSVDWVTADYNSQKASSTFIVWGTQTSASGKVKKYTNLVGIGASGSFFHDPLSR